MMEELGGFRSCGYGGIGLSDTLADEAENCWTYRRDKSKRMCELFGSGRQVFSVLLPDAVVDLELIYYTYGSTPVMSQ